MHNECLVYSNDKHCISDKQLINFLMPTNECQRYKLLLPQLPEREVTKAPTLNRTQKPIRHNLSMMSDQQVSYYKIKAMKNAKDTEF